jgi:hypothetical protein
VCSLPDVEHHWQLSATSVFIVLACSKWIVQVLWFLVKDPQQLFVIFIPTISFSSAFVQSTFETFEGF